MKELKELKSKNESPLRLARGCRVVYLGNLQSLRGKKGIVQKVRHTPKGRRAIVLFDHDIEDAFDICETSLTVIWSKAE